jgi:hypothetical protein
MEGINGLPYSIMKQLEFPAEAGHYGLTDPDALGLQRPFAARTGR